MDLHLRPRALGVSMTSESVYLTWPATEAMVLIPGIELMEFVCNEKDVKHRPGKATPCDSYFSPCF